VADTSVGINLIGRDISATRALQHVGRQAEMTSSKFSAMGSMMKGALVGASLAAGAFAVKIGVDSVKAAVDDEAATQRLAVALKNIGAPEQLQQAQDYIDKLGMLYGVTDDEARPALQRLAEATGSLGAAQGLLNVALDVSAGSSKSLEAVSVALAKAAGGQTAALGKLVPGLDQATLKSGDLSKITDELSKRFGGQAAAAADTWEGKIKRLSVAGDELKEAFGYGILDGFNQGIGKGSTGVDGLVQALHDAQPGIQALGKQLGVVGGELIHVVGWLGQALSVIEGIGIQAPITGQRISLMTGLIGGAMTLWGEFQSLTAEGGPNQMAPELAAKRWEAVQRAQDKAEAWNRKHPGNRKSYMDFNVEPTDPADAAAAAAEKAYQAYLKNLKGRATPKGGSAAKAVADSISAPMQEALDLAQAKMNAYANSQASGFGEAGMNVITQLVAGIHLGGKSQKTGDAIRKQLEDGLAKVGDLVAKARDYGKGIAEGLMGQLDIGSVADEWQARQDAVTEALKAVVDARARITAESTDSERANLAELQSVYQKAQEDAAKGGATIVDAFVAQADKSRQFAEKLQVLLSAGLNQTSWDQIAAMSTDKGMRIANALIDGNMAQNIARTNDAVGSVKTVSDQVGAQAIKTFKLAGIEMAIAMFESMEKVITGGGTRKKILEGMQSLKDEMNRIMTGSTASSSSLASSGGSAPSDSSSMTSDEIALMMASQAAGLPAFADGGIVPATPGGRIVRVAEAGQAEAIIPLDQLGGGGGDINVYVTVQGSVASERDLVEVARQGIATGMRRRGLDPAVIGL